MKWPQRKPRELKPFLVLPLLEGERSVSADPTLQNTNRNTSSGSTGTWPPKLKLKIKKTKEQKQKTCDIERPLTATLERPKLLNINLLDKLDMSLVRKEFLCITNLCKDTVSIAVISKGKRFGFKGKEKITAPAISVTPTEQIKRSRKPETSEDSLESDENSSVRRSRKKISKVSKLVNAPVVKMKQNKNDANNNTDSTLQSTKPTTNVENRSLSRSKYTPLVSPKLDNYTISSKPRASGVSLPEPCKTCGRPDAPERFHSHPATPIVRQSPRKTPVTPAVKSSVQKPVAIKYKSQPRETTPQKTTANQTSTMSKTVEVNKDLNKNVKETETKEKTVKGPRTVTCYLCGREFGTKSLPLHEPKCLQKWERENSNLPRHLQRKPPVKPDKPMTPEEWNKFAWEASQASLTPCQKCGRTFLPDRLIIHQRSCKATSYHRPPPSHSLTHNSPGDLVLSSVSSSPGTTPGIPNDMPTSPPGTVECYICGRMFGSQSIVIHEPQCLRKWHIQNNLLPPAQRKPPPVKSIAGNETTLETSPTSATDLTGPSGANRPPSGPRKPMLPCYICGREFGTSSIYIHEPQCLKKWRLENDKLPLAQRRKEPERPDIKFTPSGEVDFIGTFHRIWENHMAELVPCRICGRKFFPDRIEKHEQACNNLPIKLKKRKI